jgi:hypothetical protein
VKRRVVMFYTDYLTAERKQNIRKTASAEVVFFPTLVKYV